MADVSPYDVVVPAYNAQGTIAECLASILGQTAKPATVLVVDDGSTDQTAAIVAGFGPAVSLVRQQNAGPGAATTAGMTICISPAFAVLDRADLWLQEKLAFQIEHLALNPECAGVFGKTRHFRDGELLDTVEDGWSRTTMAIRREVFQTVGAIVDPPGRRGEMIDWMARAREAGFRLDMADRIVAHRRIHPGSLTFTRAPEKDVGYLHVARQAILRRRAAELAKSDEKP